MKRPIFVPQVEGTASRQAHADMPAGTYEREISKEGFFGPAAFFHHKHPPTGWVAFEGPLRPHAFDLNKLARSQSSPWQAADVLRNAHVRMRFWQTSSSMDHLVRNADGDDLLFLHQGTGEFHCDYGHLTLAAGDYVVIPRGTMWRIETQQPLSALLIEATNSSYSLPDKGMLGNHAIFDPAMLDVPKMDVAFVAQQSDDRAWQVRVKRNNAV
ncbi:MAG TPA: homogentisate 1,2-dioxygenase, partial [Steroidobacteraceae bacterium]|nr:homogentisate 1,2-dioxygenase [Steroidobacteraceae bacterium]